MANLKTTDLTLKTVIPTDAQIAIVSPSDLSQSSTGSDYRVDIATFLTQTFRGAITLASAAPTVIGSYIPTQSGTYTNFGSKVIDLTTGSAIIIYDGTTFSVQKTTIDLTLYVKKSDSAKLETWIDGTYINQVQRLKDGIIYELLIGETANSGDVPGISPKWIKKTETFGFNKTLNKSANKLLTKKNRIELQNGKFYNYKTGVESSNASFAGLKMEALEGDVFSFKGDVGFSSISAISFFDVNMNVLIYYFGDNTSTIYLADTGIVIAPKNTAFVTFGSTTTNQKNTFVYIYEINTYLESVYKFKFLELINKTAIKNTIITTDGGLYDKNGVLLLTATFPASSEFKYVNIDVTEGEIYRYISKNMKGGSVFGVQLLDVNNGILNQLYTTNSFGVLADFDETFIIPKNCTKLLVNLTINLNSFIYKLTLNSDRFLTEIDIPEKTDGVIKSFFNAWDYNFLSTINTDFANSGFTYDATNKIATSSTANSFLVLNKNFKTYNRKHHYILKLNTTTVVEIGSSAVNNAVTYQSRGSIVRVDVPNGKLKILNVNNLAMLSEVNITNFVNNDDYSLEIYQKDFTLQATLKNNRTLQTFLTSYTSNPIDSPQGKLIDYPSIKLISGSVSVVNNVIFLLKNPLIIFVGDSITESGYRVSSYADKLIKNEFKNDGVILAKGGANNDVLSINTLSEIAIMKPKYLSILIGTNGGITSSQINTWITFCNANDIKLIVNRITATNDNAINPFLISNQTIRDKGVYGANMDYATALNNDPLQNYDVSLFLDTLHPNDLGHTKMLQRFLNDVKII